MRLIVGLGNPGKEYSNTRHNLGFLVLDELARRHSASPIDRRFRAETRQIRVDGEPVLLLAPQTFMNLSGVSAREALRWYHLPPEEMLVVVDDMNLPFGSLRMREQGSSGGHNGLQSIIDELGDDIFPRLRGGIGRGRSAATSHVLSRFNDLEEKELPALIGSLADGAERWVSEGAVAAMNLVNVTKAETDQPAIQVVSE